MSKRDYYEVLGVAREASDADLKRAFRELARRYHPDKNKDDGADERFREVQEAYAVLSDAQKRAQYDRWGHEGPQTDFFGPSGFRGFDINLDDLFSGRWEDLFGGLFGGGTGRHRGRGRARGHDLLVRHEIDFEVSIHGGTEEVEVRLITACEACSGTGAADPAAISVCDICGGNGQVMQTRSMGGFIQQTVRECPTCRGRGKEFGPPCTICDGEGHQALPRVLRIDVPAGTHDGIRLRMRGEGEPARGGDPGDLLIELDVRPHAWLERHEADLLLDLPVSVVDLLLGATLSLPHVDGRPLEVKVPAGSRPGDTIRVRGRGLDHGLGARSGDAIARLQLHVPGRLDKSTKKALRELGEALCPNAEAIDEVLSEAARRRRTGGRL